MLSCPVASGLSCDCDRCEEPGWDVKEAEPEGVVLCGKGVEVVFPVGGWTRERIEVRTGIMSRLDVESASGSFGVFDMMLNA